MSGTESGENQSINEQEEEHAGVLNSISPFRIFLAAMIGLSVVVYMFVKDFNAEEFKEKLKDWLK